MAKKENGTRIDKPWEGIMSEAKYNQRTKNMTPEEKKEFDYGLVVGDGNLMLVLHAQDMQEAAQKRAAKRGSSGARGRKNGPKK